MSMGGGGSSGPTRQQVDLQTEQALTNAQLNLEENQQRKTVLNAMYGTRVFRGSALSRAIAGNKTDEAAPTTPAAPAANQVAPAIAANGASLLDNIAGGVAGSPGAVAAAPTGSSSSGRVAGGIGRPGGGGIGSGR